MEKGERIEAMLPRWYIVTAVLLVAALVMQIVPKSTIMVFAGARGVANVAAYSYFDFMHVGYGNWLFLLSGIATAAALALSVVNIFKKNKKVGVGCSLCASGAFLLAGAGTFIFTALTYLNALFWVTLGVLFLAALSSFGPFIVMMKK